MVDVQPDPKPAAVGGIGRKKPKSQQRAGRDRWEEIRAKKLGPCVVCLYLNEKQELDSSIHHVVAKSLGGSDCESNCVSTCGDGTTGHHGLIEAHDQKVCQAFAAAIQIYDGDAYSYAIEKLGEDRFLRRYKVRFESVAERAA